MTVSPSPSAMFGCVSAAILASARARLALAAGADDQQRLVGEEAGLLLRHEGREVLEVAAFPRRRLGVAQRAAEERDLPPGPLRRTGDALDAGDVGGETGDGHPPLQRPDDGGEVAAHLGLAAGMPLHQRVGRSRRPWRARPPRRGARRRPRRSAGRRAARDRASSRRCAPPARAGCGWRAPAPPAPNARRGGTPGRRAAATGGPTSGTVVTCACPFSPASPSLRRSTAETKGPA